MDGGFDSFFKSVMSDTETAEPNKTETASGSSETVRPSTAAPLGDPWLSVSQRYPVGARVMGRVAGTQPYGVFLDVEPGVRGLLHVSLMGPGCPRIEDFVVGQKIPVQVVQIQPELKRMAFSYGASHSTMSENGSMGQTVSVPAEIKKWVDENADASHAAHAFFVKLLEQGPIHVSLLNVLTNRFGVPRPVSAWIRLFPEFTSFGARAGSPKGQPCVALTSRVSDAAYWAKLRFKLDDGAQSQSTVSASKSAPQTVALVRFTGVMFGRFPMANQRVGVKLESCRDLSGAPLAQLDVLHEVAPDLVAGIADGDRVFGAYSENADGSIALVHLERLDSPPPASAVPASNPPVWCALDAFPDSKWIRRYLRIAAQMDKQDAFGMWDNIERLVVPMLGQLGWSVSNYSCEPLSLVRGRRSSGYFDLNLYQGVAGAETLVLAVDCRWNCESDDDPLGTADPAGRFDANATRVVWTNGIDWIVFDDGNLSHRAEILAAVERAGSPDEKIPGCTCIAFPEEAQTPEDVSKWLDAFARLSAKISASTLWKGGAA